MPTRSVLGRVLPLLGCSGQLLVHEQRGTERGGKLAPAFHEGISGPLVRVLPLTSSRPRYRGEAPTPSPARGEGGHPGVQSVTPTQGVRCALRVVSGLALDPGGFLCFPRSFTVVCFTFPSLFHFELVFA